MSTDIDIEALRGLLANATPGPWVVFDMDDANKMKNQPLNGPGEGWYWVWSEPRLPHYGAVLEPDRDYAGAIGSAAINDSRGGLQERNDADLICAAVNALPDLLDEVERLRATVARVEEVCADVLAESQASRDLTGVEYAVGNIRAALKED